MEGPTKDKKGLAPLKRAEKNLWTMKQTYSVSKIFTRVDHKIMKAMIATSLAMCYNSIRDV